MNLQTPYLKILLFFLVLLGGLFLLGCQPKKYTYLKPTEEFYINDTSHALTNYTQWNIFINGQELYEESLAEDFILEDIKGTQVVVLTTTLDQSTLDTTTLFNEWGIGKNNMGILLVLFFSEPNNEFLSITYEIGSNMMGYFSVFEMNQYITEYFFNPQWFGDYELGLLELYHEILRKIYVDIYGYLSYSYDMDYFISQTYEAYVPLPSHTPKSLFESLVSLDIPPWLLICILLAVSFLGIGSITGVRFYKTNKGGGGRSLGYFFNRKK